MGVTSIKRLENRSRSTVTLINVENRSAPGSGRAVAPGERVDTGMDNWIPWAGSGDFAAKHLEVQFNGVTRFWIWQALNADGDHVRFSIDGRWHDRGEPVDGISAVDGDRTLVVFDDGVQLVDVPAGFIALLRGVLASDRYRLDRSVRLAATSVPKLTTSTFSVPGFASDTMVPRYRDTGKRYDFRVDGGVVVAIHPDGGRESLANAISYDERRVGVPGPAPAFDMIAAGGGRVLAKARGDDRFYFLAMDETFVHQRPTRTFVVPSTYFKLDPEANRQGANPNDLTRPISGAFGQHPAAERFPLFRTVLAEGLTDMMVVAVQKRVWHLLDPRPGVGVNGLIAAAMVHLADLIGAALTAPSPEPINGFLRSAKGELERLAAAGREGDVAPPADYPSYEHVVHRAQSGTEMKLRSVQFRRVLDIGVGHVNWHEQYSGITGGEIQPMNNPMWATLYRFVAGQVRDGDGYIDGTCNFYALVELSDPSGAAAGYAVLYQDEQSYFTGRWRVVDPADNKGLLFATVADPLLAVSGFDRAKWWNPFKAGVIGPASRLAVAAQVLLVTGDARAEPQRRRIYSTNWSWSTMDRSWRWRELPASAEVRHFDAAAEAAGSEPIAAAARDTVYPQTIRLREDMTLHLKGTRARPGLPVETGRWYQRYLPSANTLVPGRDSLVAGSAPALGYTHAWKFLPEEAWSRADRFSHLGVHDAVDSRSQYYEVTPAGAADARALAEAGADGWVDGELRLSRWTLKLNWSAPLHILTPTNLVPGVLDRRPPSQYNVETRLRIVSRNGRWIGMHWDKRDDDLLPLLAFDNVPATVTLTSGTRRATVTLGPHRLLEQPPAVQRAEFRWSGEPGEPASIVLRPPPERAALADTLWRLRIAALTPGPVHVLDVQTAGAAAIGGGAVEYRWTPTDAQATALRTYCTEAEAPRWATSLWVENVVGQVAVPEEVAWVWTAPMTLVVDRTISVPEASAGVDTGIDLEPGDDFALEGGGQIKSGVLFTSWNGPQGWTNVDHDPKFPFHDGPDAHPFALIGRLAGLPWFYVGARRARSGFRDGPRRRLYLRTNDDAPGNGEGAFTCRVQVWRVLARHARFVSQAMPSQLVAGQSADAEVRMRNAGTATWTPQASFRLGAETPGWGPARVELPGTVPTGGEAVFRFRVTAPPTPGVHGVRWRMLQEGVEWFGPSSPQVDVTVTGAGEPAECATLRTQRNELRDLIADLESQLADLPPRAAAAIRAALARNRTQLTALEQRARELGCAL